MDEREAARNGSFPSRDFLGTSFEMAGTGFSCSGNDLRLVAVLQTASKSFFFPRKHPLANFSGSTYSRRSYRSDSVPEERGRKLPGLVLAPRMHIPAQAELNAASENS
jgi:hypothetical protein